MADDDSKEKNVDRLQCPFCPSVILLAGQGVLEVTEFELPSVHQKAEMESQTETVTRCWLVKDMFHFENVGFSHTVGPYKYLTCADCEVGPIGWHSIETKLSYIADERVKHVV